MRLAPARRDRGRFFFGTWPCMLIALAAALCAALLAGRVSLAQEGGRAAYSPYEDPLKPALSAVISSDADLAAFRERFGLTDEEAARVLSALRSADAALAEEHEQSDRLLAANRGLSRDALKSKVAASDYDARVRETVAGTKKTVEGIVGESRKAELRAWVDDRFAADAREFYAEAAQPDAPPPTALKSGVQTSGTSTTTRSAGYSCRVWSTYYQGYTSYEVALPFQYLKFKGGVQVGIRNSRGDSAPGPVKEVGPWNVRDNYWVRPADRAQWKNLPRCVPEAAAAYYNNYNHGKDGYGREVLNPAGFDMTLAVAKSLGVGRQIQRYGKVRVSVYFPWVSK